MAGQLIMQEILYSKVWVKKKKKKKNTFFKKLT